MGDKYGVFICLHRGTVEFIFFALVLTSSTLPQHQTSHTNLVWCCVVCKSCIGASLVLVLFLKT